MKKKIMNLKKVANSLTGEAREFVDEVVAMFEDFAQREEDFNITTLKDELAKIEAKFAAKFADKEEVANKIAEIKRMVLDNAQGGKSIADKFTKEVKDSVVRALTMSESKEQAMAKINEIAKANGIELRTKKNDISGITYQEFVDYALNIHQDNSDEVYDELRKVAFGTFFYGELDGLTEAQIAKQWDKGSTTEKDIQELQMNGKTMTTKYIYKRQRIANEDLDAAEEAGQLGALQESVFNELRKSVKAGAVRAMLIGDSVNAVGKRITSFETIGTKTATDIFTTVLNPEQAGELALSDLLRVVEAVKTENKVLVLSSASLSLLRTRVYGQGGSQYVVSKEDLAMELGVRKIVVKDYLDTVDGLLAIVYDPYEYVVKERKIIEVAFPQYENNTRNYLYEINAAGAIKGLKSTAVLREL